MHTWYLFIYFFFLSIQPIRDSNVNPSTGCPNHFGGLLGNLMVLVIYYLKNDLLIYGNIFTVNLLKLKDGSRCLRDLKIPTYDYILS